MKRVAFFLSFLLAINVWAATPTPTRTRTRTPTRTFTPRFSATPFLTATPVPTATKTPTPDQWGWWFNVPQNSAFAVGPPDQVTPYVDSHPNIPTGTFFFPCDPKNGGNPYAADYASSGCQASIQAQITPSTHGGVFRMGWAVHYGGGRFPDSGGWSKVNAPTAVVYDPSFPPTSTPQFTATKTRTPTRIPPTATKTITPGGPPTKTPTLLPCSQVPPGAPIPCRTSTPTPGGPTMTPTAVPKTATPTPTTPPACGDAFTLCVGTGPGLHKISVNWAVPAQNRSGPGMAVQMTSDTGYFWFFDQNNVEMVIKVLDGCGVNSHYWVFAGGLTNVQVDTTVTEVKTGLVKTYHADAGPAFPPLQDTTAFPCPTVPTARLAQTKAMVAVPSSPAPSKPGVPVAAQVGLGAAFLAFSIFWVRSRKNKLKP